MKVLVVGGGGREHALAWALSRDPAVTELYAAPGNPGIAEIAKCVTINPTSIKQLLSFALEHSIDLTVVGPEAPLALGIVDSFRERGLRIFGPDRSAARASKALDYFGPAWVIKADGLAAGKGTTVTQDRREAETAIDQALQRDPGRVVLEEFIDGWEATFMATVSGNEIQWVTPVFQDYMPIFDGDTGPNTGGMGCYTPVPTVTPSLVEKVKKTILAPTVAAMDKTGAHYHGVLNLNAIVQHGTEDPYVLEFNARFGDPEGQGVMALVERGLANHLYAVAEDMEKAPAPQCRESACVVVVLASKGYPTSQSIGDKITIQPTSTKNVQIFHAGTAASPSGELVTAGGRVLNVVATGPTVESARREAYSVIGKTVQFNGMHYRSDIGAGRTRQRNLQVPRA